MRYAHYVARKGEINAWDNADFVATVKATGRKTLIIAGTITEVLDFSEDNSLPQGAARAVVCHQPIGGRHHGQ